MNRHLNLSKSQTALHAVWCEAVACVPCACRLLSQVPLTLVAASLTAGVVCLALDQAHSVPLVASDAPDAPPLTSDSTQATAAAVFHMSRSGVSQD